MTEDEYRLLTRVCDDILLGPGSSVERVAIRWLHVLSEHPHNLMQYAELFDDRQRGLLRSLRRIGGRVAHAVSTFREGGTWFYGDRSPDRADVLFVSHFVNAAQAGAASDFYFGELPDALAARGRTCAVALINHVEHPAPTFMPGWVAAKVPRIVLSRTLGVRGEATLARRLRSESRRLRIEACGARDDFHRRALLSAAGHARSMNSVIALRIGEQVAELVRRIRPGAIVATYEAHAWERVVFAAARSVHPAVRCIGYHHTILFPRQHAVKRRLGGAFDPDLILTAGPATRDQLACAPGLGGIPIGVLGTHRRSPVPQTRRQPPDGPPTCLVIPEGLPGECLVLFDFALQCAKLAPSVRFLLRMHPVLTFASIAAQDSRLQSLPPNVEVSAIPIAGDYARSRWALYRGSSAAVHAVLAGIRPIYVSRPGELSFDPMHELASWRSVVSTAEEFLQTVESDLRASQDRLNAEAAPAMTYCQNYFSPVDVVALDSALQSA
jgi:hypothetical protein